MNFDKEKAIKIGETPVMNEKNVFPDILKEHMTPKDKWAVLVVEEGSLEFQWKGDESILIGDIDNPIIIEPERVHHVILIGPVKFKVEFYKVPKETTTHDSTALRPGENFIK